MSGIGINVTYLIMAAIVTVTAAEYANKYCSLCQPGNSSGDRANHTMCLYQVSYLKFPSLCLDSYLVHLTTLINFTDYSVCVSDKC
jgi:hypothetical protein